MNRKNIIIPAVVFLLFAGLYISLALIQDNDFLFKPVWDIGHYLSIAERGYEVYPCDPAIHYPAGDICGNVGWFPAWPLTVKILSPGKESLGIILLPYLFGLLGFVLFYNLVRNLTDDKGAVIGTVALAASPTAFYLLTGFPYGFILVLFAAYLYLLYRKKTSGRMLVLPLLAILLSLSYPSAFLMALIPLVIIIKDYFSEKNRPRPARLIGNLLYYLGPFALGPLLLSLYFHFKFDDFLLILHFQEKYERNWDFPLAVIWKSLRNFQWSTDAHFMKMEHTHFAANFIILWYGLVFLVFYPYKTRVELVIFTLVLFLFSPATGSIFSVWRHYLLLFPAAIIIAGSARPSWLKIGYIIIGLFLALWIYFPVYMRGFLV